MTEAIEFEIDRIMAHWPRLYAALRGDPRVFAKAFEVIRALERKLATGEIPSAAIKQVPPINRLRPFDQRRLATAARHDLKARSVGQPDLLDSRLVLTLDELLTQVRSDFPEAATTSFESGEDVRPRFRDVSDVFVAYHRRRQLRWRTNWCGRWNPGDTPVVLLLGTSRRARGGIKGYIRQ